MPDSTLSDGLLDQHCTHVRQGPFDTAAELAAAFQQGQLQVCSLPAPFSSVISSIGWATTVPFAAPLNNITASVGVNDRSIAPLPKANGGLQSQVLL